MELPRTVALVGVTMLSAVAGGCGSVVSAGERELQIALSANRGGAGSVMLVDSQGRDRLRLKDGIRSPSWSADGERLAVTRELGNRDTDIAVIQADGTGQRVLSSGAHRDDDPAFSPDGEWVAFSRIQSIGTGRPRAAIYAVRADGSDLRRVTRGNAFDRQPAWSPDGARLAFTRVTLRGGRLASSVVVAASSGRASRDLVRGSAPAWSSDGRRIAYVTGADRFGETCFHDCAPSGEIHVISVDGGRDKRLTRSRADDADPAWTSDGRQILFSSDRSDRSRHDRELWAMTSDGGCVTRLTNASSWSVEPAWRPGAEGAAACEPSGIAAGARKGTVDVDLAPARAFSSYPLFWLGQRYRGLMLSHVQRSDQGFADNYAFIYDDCEKARAASCPGRVDVESMPLCWWRKGPAPVRLRRVGRERGAPVFVTGRRTGEYAQAEIHTGESAVRVTTETASALRRAIARVRPLDGVVGPLAPPARSCK